MAKIECTWGPAETPVSGHTYRFEKDKAGRYVATVHNDDHVEILLSVEHYRLVDDDAPAAPGLAPPEPEGETQPLSRVVALPEHGVEVPVDLHPSPEGGYTVTAHAYPGCVSEGETIDEAHANMAEALRLHLENDGPGATGTEHENERPAHDPHPLDHDGDGKPGGSLPKNPPLADDDVTRINGIGPGLKTRLHQEAGITSLLEIAVLTPEQVGVLDEKLKLHGRIVRDQWVEKAKAIVDGA